MRRRRTNPSRGRPMDRNNRVLPSKADGSETDIHCSLMILDGSLKKPPYSLMMMEDVEI